MSLKKINEKFSKKKFQNRINSRDSIMLKKKVKFKNIFIIVYLLLAVVTINITNIKKTHIFTSSTISWIKKKKKFLKNDFKITTTRVFALI